MALPYLGKYFINFIEGGNMGVEFWNLFKLSFLILFTFFIFSSWEDYLFAGLLGKYEMDKTEEYHKKFLELDYNVRINEGTGKTITKMSRGIGAKVQLFNMIYHFINIFIVRLGLIGILFFTIYPPIVFIFFILATILTVGNILVSSKVKVQTDKEQKIMENIGRQTSKIIMESNLIKTLNKEKRELSNLAELTKPIPKIRKKIYLINGIIYNILDVIIDGIRLLTYAILGALVVKSSMSIGELTMTITYIGWLWWPISMLLNNLIEMRNKVSQVEALEKLVNIETNIKDGKKKFALKKGEINFDNITFKYEEGKTIFKDFSLKIDGGKTIALVGHSGSGKSTLIKLILRNYLVNSGKLEIDSQDIKDLKISSFYDNIGYLSQDPAVFDGTIRQNLEYATDKKLSDDELYTILKKIDLYDLIFNSKNKLNTEIGEKGLKLSGGEKQRLAIARIFLRNPKILILDEPTSSLDSISENKITKLLNQVMKGRTVIVIAHRLQTVMEADKIVVLKSGQIIESGTHDELIKGKGIYSKLVDLQRGIINED